MSISLTCVWDEVGVHFLGISGGRSGGGGRRQRHVLEGGGCVGRGGWWCRSSSFLLTPPLHHHHASLHQPLMSPALPLSLRPQLHHYARHHAQQEESHGSAHRQGDDGLDGEWRRAVVVCGGWLDGGCLTGRRK